MTTRETERPATPATDEHPQRTWHDLVRNQQAILLAFIVVMIAFFTWRNSIFFSQAVLTNVLNDWCPIVLLAVGQTFVVVTGGIDLSVGSNVAMSGVVAALAMRTMTESGTGSNTTLLVGLLIAAAVGTVVGLVNAVLINKAKLVAFVATLATLGICQGLALVWTQGGPVGGGPSNTIEMSVANIGPFSRPILLVFVVVIVAGLVLHLTRFGRYTFAIGSNAFAARSAGINVRRHIVKVYALSGFLAGLAGMFYYLRLGTGSPSTGIGRELDSIAAVVIGGVALSGGVGRITGTALGALVISTLASGLVIIDVEPTWRLVAVGVLIGAAGALQGLLGNSTRSAS